MKENFLDTSVIKKYLINFISVVIEVFALFYVGLHQHTPIASIILWFCIGVYLLTYVLGTIVIVFINKNFIASSERLATACCFKVQI